MKRTQSEKDWSMWMIHLFGIWCWNFPIKDKICNPNWSSPAYLCVCCLHLTKWKRHQRSPSDCWLPHHRMQNKPETSATATWIRPSLDSISMWRVAQGRLTSWRSAIDLLSRSTQRELNFFPAILTIMSSFTNIKGVYFIQQAQNLGQ